jgi:hypothetical protein
MAKKKKRTLPGKAETPSQSQAPSAGGAGYLWLAALGGLLWLLAWSFIPWVSVGGTNYSGPGLVIGAFRAGEIWEMSALLTILAPAFLAFAAPFAQPGSRLRDALASATAGVSAFSVLVLVIFLKSTLNFLAFGAGRQTVPEGSPFFLYLPIGLMLFGSAGYLLHRDDAFAANRPQVTWFAAFLLLLFALVYFNFSVIPDSIIPPPEFVRQRLMR